MPIIKGLETTFNTVYSEYDRWRPTYVKELYEDIFAAKEVNETSNVLEVGIGTGQATLPILETSCALTAIELGDKLAEYSKEKFRSFNKFQVINIAFQDYECTPNTYDLIYSASAFHWIPEEIGYTKVYNLLKVAVCLLDLQITPTKISYALRYILYLKKSMQSICLGR